MFTRNDEDMDGRGWIDIQECDHLVILVCDERQDAGAVLTQFVYQNSFARLAERRLVNITDRIDISRGFVFYDDHDVCKEAMVAVQDKQ